MEAGIKPLTVSGRIPKRIVIVGNTESAWMAAACISRQFSLADFGCRITVVTDGSPTEEFAAESSRPSIRGLLSNLRTDEHTMMRACRATWQLATQFSDWVQMERDFWLPFPTEELRIGQATAVQGWHAERLRGRLLRPLHSYSLHWAAALAGKGPYGFAGPSMISRSGTYAFHLDGTAFATWLRSVAISCGTEELHGTAAVVSPNGRGGIGQIKLADGTVVAGDFFIDCTGSTARLISCTPGNDFISWNDQLPCDLMLRIRLPGRRQVPAYTRITGLRSGWAWQIPLAGCIDAGCVIDSSVADDADAWTQLQESLLLDGLMPASHAGSELSVSVPPDLIVSTLRQGRRQHYWHDNVLALGTAASQMDPLNSAGRHLCQLGIEMFLELFPERTANSYVMDYYNERMRAATDEFKDIARLKYLLSKRKDTEYWRKLCDRPVSEQLQQRLQLFDTTGTTGLLAPEACTETEWWYILAGGCRLPATPTLHAGTTDPTIIQGALREILKYNESALRDLPLHEEMLDWIHVESGTTLKSA